MSQVNFVWQRLASNLIWIPLKSQQNLIFSRVSLDQIGVTLSKRKEAQQMQRRYTLSLATIVLLTLTAGVDAQAQIAFVSDRDGNLEIYVMDADGG